MHKPTNYTRVRMQNLHSDAPLMMSKLMGDGAAAADSDDEG